MTETNKHLSPENTQNTHAPNKKRNKPPLDPYTAALKKRAYRIRKIITMVFIGIFVFICLVLLVFAALGWRFVRRPIIDPATGTRGFVQFVGRMNRDGDLTTGTLFFPDNSRAIVTLLDNGMQQAVFPNGNVFVGEMMNLQKHGQGRLELGNGDVFEGQFMNNVFHGQGRYYFRNGDFFEGNFENGMKSGEGIYIWAEINGRSPRFEGNFENGMRNGHGVFYFDDGSRYEGNFVNDVKHDYNAYLQIRREVDGEIVIDVFRGAFYNNMRHGYGVYTWGDSGEVFRGYFYRNRIHGQGTYFWLSGRTFTGEFRNGQMVLD